MTKAIVTLITDFGLRDHFAASVKGALLKECPDCAIVDITHEVPPFDVRHAAFLLWASWRAFPRGTAHLAVVDPGVGTARAFLHMEREGHHFFAPDNGLLTYVLPWHDHLNRIVFPPELAANASPTFHARDLFAPCVGGFLNGEIPEQLTFAAPVRLTYAAPMKLKEGSATGRVMEVDRFGNLITDLPLEWLTWGRGEISIGGRALRRWAQSYEDLPEGEVGLLKGSLGTLEIASRRSSAAKTLGVGAAATVVYGM